MHFSDQQLFPMQTLQKIAKFYQAYFFLSLA